MKYACFLLLLLASLFPPAGFPSDSAAAGDAVLGQSEEPLAVLGSAVVTQGEIDAAFSRIPEEYRLAFVRDGGRVDQLIRSLLQNRILAGEARKAGYDRDSLVQGRLRLAEEKELAEAWLAKVVAEAPLPDFEALAREKYLAEPERWQTEAMVDVSHILISSENKPEAEALELARSLRDQLEENPDLFDEMVQEYSEDPSKKSNQGRFPAMQRGQMVAPFEQAAFALQEPGEISAPVETNYGFHIIRLNRKIPATTRPFEEIREDAIAQARDEYLVEYRSRYLRQHLSGQIQIPDGAVDAMAKRYFGEDLERASFPQQ